MKQNVVCYKVEEIDKLVKYFNRLTAKGLQLEQIPEAKEMLDIISKPITADELEKIKEME